MKPLIKLAHSIADKVEESLGFDLKKLDNLLLSDDSGQRNYERFFRDLFNIPTPSKALLELSKGYVLDSLSEQEMNNFVDDTEYIEDTANDVLETFKYQYRAGHYSLGHIPPVSPSKDVGVLLKSLKNKNHEKVLRMYYGFTEDGRAYKIPKIAHEMNLTKQRVSDIKNRTLKKIRDSGGLELAEKYSSIAVKANIKDTVIILKFDSLITKLEKSEDQIKEALSNKPVVEGPERYFEKSIDILNLSSRPYNCLRREDIEKIGQLVEKKEADILRIKNMGIKSSDEIKKKLSTLGLSFGMNTIYKEII